MMKRITTLVAALAAFPLFAQPTVQSVAAPRTVSISPVESDVREVIRELAKQTGARILIGTEVTGKVTARLENATLEQTLTVVTRTTNLRWARLAVAADKADAVTPEQAASLVAAADTLVNGALLVQSGPTAVSVAAQPPAPPAGAVNVYLILTKADPAAIKAARDEARRKASDKAFTDREKAFASVLSPDAAKDPGLVKAYTAVQGLQPDQIAVLFREYVSHSTPQQLQLIGEAMQRARVSVHSD